MLSKDLKKKIRKQWKRRVRYIDYPFVYSRVKLRIKQHYQEYKCRLRFDEKFYFAVWILSKKLEVLGFSCKVEREYYDCGDVEIYIEW